MDSETDSEILFVKFQLLCCKATWHGFYAQPKNELESERDSSNCVLQD